MVLLFRWHDGRIKTLLSSKDNANVFPLYLYDANAERRPNINSGTWARINETVGRETTPEELVGYVYGVLHSAAYRERYKEFLKVDFPRIPYPESAERFGFLAAKGNELIQLHLMKDARRWPTGVTFPEQGDNRIEEIAWKADNGGRAYINKTQYLGNVSALAWNAYIGGYQPAQKWLKDRKGRTLGFNDIMHYGRILYALEQTDRIMREIDEG